MYSVQYVQVQYVQVQYVQCTRCEASHYAVCTVYSMYSVQDVRLLITQYVQCTVCTGTVCTVHKM